MTAVLRNLPYRDEADEVSVGFERIPVLPYQIIVWVSVTARTRTETPALGKLAWTPQVPTFRA